MNKKIISLFTLITLLAFPMAAFAAPLNVMQIIDNLRNKVIWPVFVGAIVIMFIFAGFKFATAAGDPSKIQTAKKAVAWAVVGVVVGIAAFSAEKIIRTILNV